MKRYLSVWLPRWPIERRCGLLAMQQGNALPPETDHAPSQPLVLSSMVQSGAQITAANAAAIRLGLFTGMPVADARAIHPPLLVEPADPKGDEEALRRLALR